MKNSWLSSVCLSLTAMLLLPACLSISSLQSARTLKKGEYSVALGAGTRSEKSLKKEKSNLEKKLEKSELPFLELYLKYSLMDNFDFGLKYSGFQASFDAKYMLIGKGKSLSFSLGSAYMYDWQGECVEIDDDTNPDGYKSICTKNRSYLLIPLYLSYDFSREFSVHFVPRVQQGVRHIKDTLYGLNIGFNWKWFILEGGYLFNTKDLSGVQQITFALSSAWDDLNF